MTVAKYLFKNTKKIFVKFMQTFVVLFSKEKLMLTISLDFRKKQPPYWRMKMLKVHVLKINSCLVVLPPNFVIFTRICLTVRKVILRL